MLQITFSPEKDGPLYQQLYRAVTAQIRSGQLAAGEKMPGKRTLAGQLGVSVNTVDGAYQMLAAEGWLEARPRSGYYVRPYQRPLAPAAPAPDLRPARTAVPARTWAFDLSTGGVDTGLFPFRTWARIQKELLYSRPGLLAHGEGRGDEELRAAIARHLRAWRGVDCTPDQIVVGAGVEYLMSLLARVVGSSITALENPGYARTRRILHNNGIRCVPVAVDEQGLDPDALAAAGARLVYVTPSHQFPTGAVMPVGRRTKLLNWAAAAPGRYIIEDDYDSEFRFDVRPLPSLQGMAGREGPVIYLSTFSRSLAPSIRIAYMVLPEQLLPAWHAKYALYSGTVSRFEQQTLARFITGGYFTRHLARERVAYKARRDALTKALREAFAPEELHLTGLHTGLHLLAELRDPPPDDAFRAAAEAEGVRLSLLSDYDLTGGGAALGGTLVLGYGSLADESCASVGETLKRVCTAAWESSVRV